MADHPFPPQTGPQTGVKGIKADAQKRAETDLDLKNLAIDERNRTLQSKSFQAQTHDEEYQNRAVEQAERLNGKVAYRDGSAKGKDVGVDQHEGEGDEEEDDQAFRREWRERRLQEMKQKHHSSHHSTEVRDGQDETNDDWKLEKHRLREVGPEGFLKAVEGSGWTAVLLYEPVGPFFLPVDPFGQIENLISCFVATKTDFTDFILNCIIGPPTVSTLHPSIRRPLLVNPVEFDSLFPQS
jgi:hypothetical protein